MKWVLILAILSAAGLLAWRATANAGQAPLAGQLAPDFSLPDQNGRIRSLSEFRGKWLALYFYPKDDTPGCTQEACRYRDDLGQLLALGAQVVGVSVDDTVSHARFAAKYSLPFPLLADVDGAVAARYGSIFDLGLIKFAKRNTFLIDPRGTIAKAYIKADASRNSREIVADLKALEAR